MKAEQPDFESPDFLKTHIASILDFYAPRIDGPEDGFRSCFLDDGTCYDPHLRQLVGSARYVVNYATSFCRDRDPQHLAWAEAGLDFLTRVHRQANGGYVWQIERGVVTDDRIMAYGHAFVLLAAAQCFKAGIQTVQNTMNEIFDFMETYFWDSAGRAYFDERDASLETLSPYRGQNANMHMCEALLSAWQASGETRYLNRAEALAERFAFELAAQSDGLIWEHYDADWQVDMTYNIDNPNDRYRPWGFQIGHQTEWAKLLLILDEERPNPKLLPRAEELFQRAMRMGWDTEHGGLIYGVGPDGTACSTDKHFWVQSESFAAAWRLFLRTGEGLYREDYNRLWAWSWDHMVDHKHGAWHRVCNAKGAPVSDQKSPPGKTDYHTMGACWDVLQVMGG
jgi:mannose/cellobiose epimerase-like protein (N-acyl-D-glucosamine 2-epimerase family)